MLTPKGDILKYAM
jgi:ribonuclease HI